MNILLPVDGSEVSLDAVHHALHLVDQGLKARFVLANVQEPATLYEIVLAHDAEVIENVSEDAGRHALAAAEALLNTAGVDYESAVDSGDPGQVLLEIAERYECDAIVMGSRGHGYLVGAVMGSVSQSVLQHAAMPVTIVRHDEPAEDSKF